MEDLTDMSKSTEREGNKSYCVTGATGYIGSWLVKSLLHKGYMVRATVRDPAKSLHLEALSKNSDRLRLFKADLKDEGSFDEAVDGCDGVYHVAASMEFNILEINNIESYVQSKIINPAIKGTLNLLKSCVKSKSVKRVVFTSSISTLTAKNSAGEWRPVVDESCQTPIDHVWNAKASGWVYVLSKLRTEETAFRFAEENGLDLVSVITTSVAGPFITPNIPSSIRFLLSPVTGDSEFLPILSAVNSRMGSIALVHIDDICNAHIFVMEQPTAEGRYICCVQSCPMSELINLLSEIFPYSNIQRDVKEEKNSIPCEISSNKLSELGFKYKYDAKDIMQDTVSCCIENGYLPHVGNRCSS